MSTWPWCSRISATSKFTQQRTFACYARMAGTGCHLNRCPGPAKVCSRACTAVDWTMPVLVGIFTAQTLQDDHFTDIGAQRKQSTPTGAADAEIYRSAWATPPVSMQRPADASDPNDNAHQGEGARHSCPRLALAGMHTAHSAATVPAARTVDVDLPVGCHDTPHEASYR